MIDILQINFQESRNLTAGSRGHSETEYCLFYAIIPSVDSLITKMISRNEPVRKLASGKIEWSFKIKDVSNGHFVVGSTELGFDSFRCRIAAQGSLAKKSHTILRYAA
jgi:hypothetical protein